MGGTTVRWDFVCEIGRKDPTFGAPLLPQPGGKFYTPFSLSFSELLLMDGKREREQSANKLCVEVGARPFWGRGVLRTVHEAATPPTTSTTRM